MLQIRVFGFGTTERLLPDVVVPTRLSKPSVVAVHHGGSGPALHAFMKPFLQEAMALHPVSSRCNEAGSMRPFALRIRCLIGDAKERAWMKGVVIIHLFLHNS